MNIFNLFGQNKPQGDPYWEFDEAKLFRPKLNRGEFFKLTGFDFGWFVLEPILEFVKDIEQEIELAKCLSYGQKALHFWWYVDGEVTNGGFVQFYYNGYERYIPVVLKSLEYIGDHKMVALIQKADNIYKKKKKLVDKARKGALSVSDLYDRIKEMEALDSEYYEMNNQTMANIERYMRNHPNEICVDEDGNEFDMSYTGAYATFYENKTIKESFNLHNGVVDGEFKTLYENGQAKEQIQYKNGVQTGERTEWYENGKEKYTATKAGSLFEHHWYYKNGNPKKLEHKQIAKDERIGAYKEWHENGQLSETGTYISNYERDGLWLEFYKDGGKKLEAEFKDGEFLIQNCWNDKGEHTLKDGTGLYVNEVSIFDGKVNKRTEQEYKDYKRNGPQKSFDNGVLTLYEEMKEGEPDGITRTFYKNGKIKEETIFKEGKEISKKSFLKSDDPKGVVTFQFFMEDEWIQDKELPTEDAYPVCINEDEIKRKIKFPKALLELQYQDHLGNTSLRLDVDEFGAVTKVRFKSTYMTNGEELQDVAEKLKFSPAKNNGKVVASHIYVKANFNIE